VLYFLGLDHHFFDGFFLQTCNFTAVLLQKTGQRGDETWDRLPISMILNADRELADSKGDPTNLLFLQNIVDSPLIMPNGVAWRGAREKSDVFLQTLIDICSHEGSIVADLTSSTGASLRASRASGRHFFGIEADSSIYNALLKPTLKPQEQPKSQAPASRRQRTKISNGND
jgi:hypothetical protein